MTEGGSFEGTKNTKEAYARQARARILEIREIMENVEESIKNAPDAAKKDLEVCVTDMKSSLHRAEENLKELMEAGGIEWMEMRADVDSATGAAQAAMIRARARLREIESEKKREHKEISGYSVPQTPI